MREINRVDAQAEATHHRSEEQPDWLNHLDAVQVAGCMPPGWHTMTSSEQEAWTAKHEEAVPPGWHQMSMSEQEAWTAKLRCAASFFGEITRDKLLRRAIIDSSDCLFQ